jgi:hypothetical protein
MIPLVPAQDGDQRNGCLSDLLAGDLVGRALRARRLPPSSCSRSSKSRSPCVSGISCKHPC